MNNNQNKKRLKIGFIIDVFDHVINGGVISTRRFVSLLREHHEVTVITTGDAKPGKVVVPNYYIPFCKNVMQKNDMTFGWPVKEILNEVIPQFDVIHVQLPFWLSGRAIKIAKKHNVPVVSSFHVQAENLFVNIGVKSQLAINLAYKFFLKTIYNKSDVVICPSQFAKDELTHYGLKVPSVVLSNGVLPKFKRIESKRDEELGDKFVLISVGRLAEEKNQTIIIEALKKSKYKDKIQLLLVGRGPKEESLRQTGAALPIQPIIHASGIPTEKLIYYYNTADLYVHSGTIELECMSVLEAMACGRTPLISNAEKSAASQFALDDRSLFDPENISELASKIDYWFENKDALEQSDQRYLESSRQYAIEKSVSKLEEVYFQVADAAVDGELEIATSEK